MVAPAVAAPTSIITITATIAVASGIAAAVPVTSAVAIPATIAISIAALHDNLSIGRKVGLAAGFDLSGQPWGRCQGKGSPQ